MGFRGPGGSDWHRAESVAQPTGLGAGLVPRVDNPLPVGGVAEERLAAIAGVEHLKNRPRKVHSEIPGNGPKPVEPGLT